MLERAKAGEVISFTDVKKEIEARKQQADAGERISGAGEHTAEDDAAVSAEKRKEQYAALDAEQDHDDDEAGETENPAAAENTATEDEAGETKVEPGTAAVADEKGEAGNPVAGADKVPALVEIMAAIDRIIELGKAPETWAFLGLSQTKTKKIGKTLRTIKVSLDELRAIIETPSKKPRPAADEAA